MNIKDYAIAAGLSIASAVLVTLFLGLLSLIGWWVIGALLGFCFVPIFMKIIQFYHDTNCMDLSDFAVEVEDYFKEKKKKKNSTIQSSDIDW